MTARKPVRATLAFALLISLFAAAPSFAASTEVNTANQAELEMVIGIGPDLSGRLLAERAKAPFKDWLDLQQRMAGIGPVRAGKLSASGLTVRGQTYPAAVKPAASR
ncbi:helix-hairpin-helix domain-containing protein [Ideonella azotifigens]|uniref:Helix-hairpin-helix domain-containing protein n=1 Tax=Ideonella azotifigens TaxID=513160 RepID=A0ABP3VAL1_9BURK|nr:helix-hairpin-helix domain-containing protein [Ideonella azotifigens]MCD2341369.1 helix-hairpin-helix domain-containing protein [Ideonella azotifigens]